MTASRLLELIEREPTDAIWQAAIWLGEAIIAQPDTAARETFAALEATNNEDTIRVLEYVEMTGS